MRKFFWIKLVVWIGLLVGIPSWVGASIHKLEYSASFPGLKISGYIDTTTDSLYIEEWVATFQYLNYGYCLEPVVSFPWVWKAYTPNANNTAMIPYDIPDDWNGIINWETPDGTRADPAAPLWAFVSPQAVDLAVVYPTGEPFQPAYPPVVTWYDPVKKKTVQIDTYIWEDLGALGGTVYYDHNDDSLFFSAGTGPGMLAGVIAYSNFSGDYTIDTVSGTTTIYKQENQNPPAAVVPEPSSLMLCLGALIIGLPLKRKKNT